MNPRKIDFKLMLTDDEMASLEELAHREHRGIDDQATYLLDAYLVQDILLPTIEFYAEERMFYSYVAVYGDMADLLIESSIVNRRSIDEEGSNIVAAYLTPRCARFNSMIMFKRFARFSRGGRKKKVAIDAKSAVR